MRRLLRAHVYWIAALSAVGCGGQSAETQRQLEQLNERLVVLQNDRDRLVERVDALETQLTAGGTSPQEHVETQPEDARPLLKIVRLEPAPRAEGQPGDDKQTNDAEDRDSKLSTSEEEAMPKPAGAETEPKVVLFGEGVTAGVRSAGEGVNNP